MHHGIDNFARLSLNLPEVQQIVRLVRHVAVKALQNQGCVSIIALKELQSLVVMGTTR